MATRSWLWRMGTRAMWLGGALLGGDLVALTQAVITYTRLMTDSQFWTHTVLEQVLLWGGLIACVAGGIALWRSTIPDNMRRPHVHSAVPVSVVAPWAVAILAGWYLIAVAQWYLIIYANTLPGYAERDSTPLEWLLLLLGAVAVIVSVVSRKTQKNTS